MKVFPTKDSWVSLARKPIIPDNKELEKVFKNHDICLLHLPLPEKKTSHRSKSGNIGMILHTVTVALDLLISRRNETSLLCSYCFHSAGEP